MIFEEQIARKPNHYKWTEEFINAMHNGHWTDKEFNFQSDVQDFKVNMTDTEREMITRSLSAIAQIEVAVKTFWAKVGENLPHPSIIDLGYVMANIEVIHNNAYERLLEVLEMEHIFEENLKLDIIQNRVKYLRKYLHKYYKDAKKQYVYSLILFTLYVENVSLFSQFYTINYFSRFKNLLKDTSQQVAYTSREELIHALVGIKLVNTIREEYPELFDDELIERIRSECVEAYNAECKIIDWSVNGYESEHLSADIVKNFLRNRFNDSLKQIGIAPVFEDVNKALLEKTSWFDEDVLGTQMTDFFFARDTGYTKKGQCFDQSELF
jgi:ribonucleoside-diphosphate reductase beta chain